MSKKAYWGYLVVVLTVAVPIFGHLDMLPLLEWDEARLATNSLEMLERPQNILVPTFGDQPEMWNTKPPFLIWLQALSMKAFGVGELALRLPSAVAASLLCLFLYWSVGIKLRRPLLAIITALILVTAEGYVSTHGTRTADYDSMLTMFTTMSGMMFFLFFEEKRYRYLYLGFSLLAVGVLTKGVAALFFAPAIFLYAFTRREYFQVFTSRHVYVALGLFLLIAGGYYLLREQYNPGYLKAVYQNELGGRFSEVNESHVGSWNYYLQGMIEWRFRYWILVVPLGLFAGMLHKSQELRRLTIYSSLLTLIFFTVISTAKTKLDWYDMPMYPWMSLIAGLFIYAVYCLLSPFATRKETSKLPVHVLFLLIVFAVPYRTIYYSIIDPKIDFWSAENMNMGHMLKDAKDRKININGYKLVWDEHAPNLEWYITAYSGRIWVLRLRSDEITTGTKPGDKIAIFNTNTRNHVQAQNYPLKEIDKYHGVVIYERQ